MSELETTENGVYDDIKHRYHRGDVLMCARNVSVVFKQKTGMFRTNNFEALKDINFDIYSGETLGIVGRNGAGKSTLLLLLAGIIKPDRGEIVNNNVSVSLLAIQAGFAKELSGRHNIFLSGLALGFSKENIEKKIEDIIEFSGIRKHIDVAVSAYSTGMRARLGFSIAHMLHPDILLIDETLGVGDRDFKKKSTAAMKEKIKSEQTVVLVSHSAETMKELCDRAIWIENGLVIAEGKVEDVLARYEGSKTNIEI